MIQGWPAILFAPIAIPIAMVAGLFSKGRTRTPAEVAGFVEDFIDGTGGAWDWDEFESASLSDPTLEAFRLRAVQMGPPHADVEGLRQLLCELRARYP